GIFVQYRFVHRRGNKALEIGIMVNMPNGGIAVDQVAADKTVAAVAEHVFRVLGRQTRIAIRVVGVGMGLVVMGLRRQPLGFAANVGGRVGADEAREHHATVCGELFAAAAD